MLKISIVTVTFNCESVIEETILSVIGQTYENFEYVLIDGKSVDSTLSIVEKYKEKISLIISEPDKGIFDAMNKSLNYVSGDYVVFMNAGDKFVNNNVLAKIFENHLHSEDLIYGDVYIQNELGYKLVKADAIYVHNPTKMDLVFKSQGFCHQALFTRTNILREIGFDLNYPLGADYNTTAQIYSKGNHQIYYLNFPVSVFDDRTGGASHDRMKAVLDERAVFFAIKKNIAFYFRYISHISSSIMKKYLGLIFPILIKRFRNRKYIQKLNNDISTDIYNCSGL